MRELTPNILERQAEDVANQVATFLTPIEELDISLGSTYCVLKEAAKPWALRGLELAAELATLSSVERVDG